MNVPKLPSPSQAGRGATSWSESLLKARPSPSNCYPSWQTSPFSLSVSLQFTLPPPLAAHSAQRRAALVARQQQQQKKRLSRHSGLVSNSLNPVHIYKRCAFPRVSLVVEVFSKSESVRVTVSWWRTKIESKSRKCKCDQRSGRYGGGVYVIIPAPDCSLGRWHCLPTEAILQNAIKCVSRAQPPCHETAASGLRETTHQSHTVSNSSQQISLCVCVCVRLHVDARRWFYHICFNSNVHWGVAVAAF